MGDAEITRIYEKYLNTVYKVCFMLLKNETETEDAVQNVFIKLMNQDKEFQSDEHIKAWLIVTAKNECKNTLTHWWKSKRNSMEDIGEPSYIQNTESGEITELLNTLPDKYKLPLYLYYYEGYKTEEIAKILNVKHSTLRTQIIAARGKLKTLMEDL